MLLCVGRTVRDWCGLCGLCGLCLLSGNAQRSSRARAIEQGQYRLLRLMRFAMGWWRDCPHYQTDPIADVAYSASQ